MKSLYQERAMHELCEITSSKRIFAADYQTEGVPFFRGKEITERFNGAIGVSTELFISRQKFEEIKAKFGVPKVGDLLLTSVGTLGSTYVVQPGDEFYFKDGNITWFRNFKGLNSTYLHYWLSSPAGKAEQKKCTIGSSQSAYTIVLLKEMKIALPPLKEQERIASILSAYDDLIENNTRRIAILEEMARRIYEEWFVRFRFPGHEKVKMVESELGLIPEGWALRKLGEVIELAYGKALKAEERKPGPCPVFGSSGIVGCHEQSLVDGPGIIVGRKGNVGSVHWCDVPFYPIDTVYFVRTNLPLHYVFFNLKRQHFINNDAAVPGLNRNQAYALHFLVPSDDALGRFVELCEPIFKQVRVLTAKNSNLRATRDLLLPKLISGELDVSPLPEPEEAIAA